MPKTRLLIEHACYHIYCRGNQKHSIFREKEDFVFYLAQLKRYKRKYNFRIYGYCLMPNHIHILGEPLNVSLLSKLMQCLQRSYAAYFNKKYNMVGHLWQDRFKTKVITKDRYLIDCIAYIEQNPIRAKLAQSPIEYTFSSYVERSLNLPDKLKLLDSLLL